MRNKHSTILQTISDKLGEHAGVINTQTKQLSALNQIQKRDNKKLIDLIVLYAELSACGMMDSKRKEALKEEIHKLINHG